MMSPRHRPPCRRPAQRGAALLLAMLIVTLVSTVAAGMVWQQWKAIEVESAERARTQSLWLLAGALDWARLILREDGREGGPDGLTEPWATGLAEIRLSTFLAADPHNTDTGLDAFLSGEISDAQARYNLHNLTLGDDKAREAELRILQRLCDTVGLPGTVARTVAQGMLGSSDAGDDIQHSPLRPGRLAQLRWLGLDDDTIARLAPYVVMLPTRTVVNINTASPEVLMAVTEGLDRSNALRLTQHRLQLRKGFEQLAEAQKLLPEAIKLLPRNLGTSSGFFEVTGQLRYEDSVLRERSLLRRQGTDVRVVARERLAAYE